MQVEEKHNSVSCLGNGFIQFEEFLPESLYKPFSNDNDFWDYVEANSGNKARNSRAVFHNSKENIEFLKSDFPKAYNVYKHLSDFKFIHNLVKQLEQNYSRLFPVSFSLVEDHYSWVSERDRLQTRNPYSRLLRRLNRQYKSGQKFFLDLDFSVARQGYEVPPHLDQRHKLFACVLYCSPPPFDGQLDGGFIIKYPDDKLLKLPIQENAAVLFLNHPSSTHYTIPFSPTSVYRRKFIYFSLAEYNAADLW